jgi:hypothetical protein
MATLKEDIDKLSDWIISAFKEDGLTLDYSIKSFIDIDRFFNEHSVHGKAKRGGRLSHRLGNILFSIGAYIGNSIIKNVPGSVWETNDDDPHGEINIAVKLPDGVIIWPVQRVMKRFKNGPEDSIYVYGHSLTKEFTGEEFEDSYWKINEEVLNSDKPWWQFWR